MSSELAPREARRKAGRPKGSQNKEKKKILARLEELDCDPIEGMVIIAREAMADAEKSYAKLLTDLSELDITDKRVVSTVQTYLKGNVPLRNQSFALAGQMYKELASFVYPKLKAVEHSGDIDLGAAVTKVERVVVPLKPKADAIEHVTDTGS